MDAYITRGRPATLIQKIIISILIEKGKEKSINTGGFGFQNRLRSFLMKTNNHTISFDLSLNYIKKNYIKDETQLLTPQELIKKSLR